MASEATLDKYRQKIGRMDLDSLREEIVKLEDNLVRVAGELYALDTSPDSLGTNKSYKSKVVVRTNNQTSWDQKLDAAITELKNRGERYVPSEEYGKMCDVAADVYNAVRVVYAERGEDGKSYGYDLVLEPAGFLANASGYGPFNIESIPVSGSSRARARWILDVYTRDGGCISFRGNVYRPYSFQQVSLAIGSVARM